MPTIVHVITGLGTGGAERVLLELLTELRGSHFDRTSVISLSGPGEMSDLMKDQGAIVEDLGLATHPLSPPVFHRLRKRLRELDPDVIQTWMYHADLVGGLAASGLRVPVVWGLHAGPLPPARKKIAMKVGVRLLGSLSRPIPTRIICCSETSRRVHEAKGYDVAKMIVVPNGFRASELVVEDVRHEIREELGLTRDEFLVARVGRDHPQKDIPTLLAAHAQIRESVHLVLVGEGLDNQNSRLKELIGERKRSSVHMVGKRPDVHKFYAAADLVVSSSSFGEALPMVLGEAMAIGTPVVGTDVGDTALVIGDPRRVVPACSPSQLSAAIHFVLSLPEATRRAMGLKDRERILTEYSVGRMAAGYSTLYESLVDPTVPGKFT